MIFTLSCLAASFVHAAEKPNILFLFADDQAFHTIHALGNDEIKTPNIDQLIKNGTTFTHTYNQGGWNGAICVASRAMLNTGRFLWHAHDLENDIKKQWVPNKRMWAQRMAAAGYQTFFSGKWHVKADTKNVFEVARHMRGGMPNQTDAGYDRPKSRDDVAWKPWDKKFEGFWKGGRHWSEVLGDDAVDYMSLAASDERPFFMYLAFNAPHDPRQSPKQFVDMYPVDKIQVPQTFLAEYPYDIGSNRVRDEKLAPFPRTPYSVQVNRQEYYAIITHMDHQIGRILKALKQTGQAENTWIFFTADHGLACGNHGLLGKQNMFDHSMRVPFAVTGPGVDAGRKVGQRIYLQSVMATSLALATGNVPEDVEFESLLPLLKDGKPEVTGDIYGAYTDTQRMITVGHEKLILYPKTGVSLLFDLKADPDEMTDLSSKNGSLARKRALFQEFLKHQKVVGDKLDVSEAFSELAVAGT
ncbi:sulfatase-like hydrolase/transferase [Fuerstiella marisgermanici]|uniref:sulfatase-like hydrolase/transferase n=1 Tax=Fuerstiella marisgermanici TaxID=1891926 RepID=UPI001E4FB7FA|nr:sulfatase-like hydrolase/transferase [Fuerstiella marisgermanici]